MEITTLAALEAEVAAVRAERIAPTSCTSYRSSTIRYIKWLFDTKPHLLLLAFMRELEFDDIGPTSDSIKRALSAAPDNPPVDFDSLTALDFTTWVLSMKKPNGDYHAFATYAGHRSAFSCLYRDYNYALPVALQDAFTDTFGGLEKRIARAAGAGNGDVKVGKDPLPFSLFRRLAFDMLKVASMELIFARTFMILSWSLMSRAANTVSVCYGHLEWGEDALRVYFAHMKNDQRGARPRDPRHIYANPLIPEICPLLALGIYWSTIGIDSKQTKLFPGSDQYDRFRKCFARFLLIPDIKRELDRRGIDPSHLGTHSMRKGSATYCSSGSTACPPAVAIHLRAGWSMQGVTNRYLRHDAAGDMFVGRTVCGLPIGSAEFAVLPPRFVNAACVDGAIGVGFPGLPACARGVARYAMASLIYHLPYLRDHLPTNHPLFENPLLRNAAAISELTSALGETEITATGIPPHVMVLASVHEMKQVLTQQREQQDQLVTRILDGVNALFEEHAVANGVPTCSSVATAVMEQLVNAGVVRLDSHEQDEPSPAEQEPQQPQWSEIIQQFREGTALPTGTPYQAWLQWCCRDTVHGTPPLRYLKPP